MLLKAAIYARYSSGLQRPTSIEDQVVLCKDAASKLSWQVPEECIYHDEERSGELVEQRPGYQRLLEAARRRELQAVIVEGQDRLWRNQAEMHQALRRFRYWGVKVFSVAAATELTSKTGKLIASVMGWKDEAFLEDLREKTHRGLAGQVRRGLSAGGRTYGYRTVPVTDPTRLDAHGQPAIAGYRREIHENEALIVRRIFEEYADGKSPKAIARDLNRQHVPPPRGAKEKGWTWTALTGSPRLGTGILNNPVYVGQHIWNRFQWEKNPETGKRVPRLRPKDEWLITERPELRILTQDLWERARRHQIEKMRGGIASYRRGRPPKYLFSGLLKCGVCGSNYILYNSTSYSCSFHTNRGSSVCPNGKIVPRSRIEERLLRVIQEELFTSAAVEYITRQVNDRIKTLSRRHETGRTERKVLEKQLVDALKELDNIKDAIRRGLVSDVTKQMLDEIEAKVRELRAQLEAPAPARVIPMTVLPEVIARKLQELRRFLEHDIDGARNILRDLLGEIVLKPTPKGLVAELRGNVEDLLPLEEVLRTGNSGSGGRI